LGHAHCPFARAAFFRRRRDHDNDDTEAHDEEADDEEAHDSQGHTHVAGEYDVDDVYHQHFDDPN
jgi:hypothetical protein